MPGRDRQLDKLYFRLVHVVGEGPEYVAVLIDHVHFPGQDRQECALQDDGVEDDAEHDMVNIPARKAVIYGHHDGEHDGSGSSEACPGNHGKLSEGGLKGGQQHADDQRARREGHEGGDGDGRQQDRRQP